MKNQFQICLAIAAFTLGHPGNAMADPFISSVIVSPQSPTVVSPGSNATYTVTVTKTNSGNLQAYLFVSGLPAGASASFSPSTLTFTGNNELSATSTLTIATSNSTPCGVYAFMVTAQDGGSSNLKTGGGTLIIGIDPPGPAPSLTSLSCVSNQNVRLSCQGNAGQVFLVLATTNLLNPSWTVIATNVIAPNGLANFTELDGAIYPARFYRTLKFQ